MTGNEKVDAILGALGGELDDAELDRRVAGFRDALGRLREDPAEGARIDALVAEARDDPADVTLVTHAAAGDPVAWDEIVERYAPLVWSICTRYQLSAGDIEDVGQQVWTRLVAQLGRLREPAALPGWLTTVTRRECLRVLAAAGKPEQPESEPDGEPRLAAEAATVEEEILRAERNAALGESLAGLPDNCRRLLSLLLADPPLSYAEISARLGIPVGRIGPLRARCLQRLRQSGVLRFEDEEKRVGLS